MRLFIKELMQKFNLVPIKKVYVLDTNIVTWHYKNGNIKVKTYEKCQHTTT